GKIRPALVTVERGGDFSFLFLDRTGIGTTGLDVGGGAAPHAYEAFLYGERDIYRPRETVRGVAIVRDRDLAPPPAMPLLLRHRDPQGRDRGTVRLDAASDGLAAF